MPPLLFFQYAARTLESFIDMPICTPRFSITAFPALKSSAGSVLSYAALCICFEARHTGSSALIIHILRVRRLQTAV